jgi:hypothetical protein
VDISQKCRDFNICERHVAVIETSLSAIETGLTLKATFRRLNLARETAYGRPSMGQKILN